MKSLQTGRLLKRTSSLLKLTPFLDTDGIMRVGGRIENAYEPYSARHPVVLDPDHQLTTWLITEAHIGTAHAGVERTLDEVRAAYRANQQRVPQPWQRSSCQICRDVIGYWNHQRT